jgi:hypothetical protein
MDRKKKGVNKKGGPCQFQQFTQQSIFKERLGFLLILIAIASKRCLVQQDMAQWTVNGEDS